MNAHSNLTKVIENNVKLIKEEKEKRRLEEELRERLLEEVKNLGTDSQDQTQSAFSFITSNEVSGARGANP